jgi:hypothetical protein
MRCKRMNFMKKIVMKLSCGVEGGKNFRKKLKIKLRIRWHFCGIEGGKTHQIN